MRKENIISTIIAFVLAIIGTILSYFKGTVNTVAGLPKVVILIIAFIISFAIIFLIFKYIVFVLILKKKDIIPTSEIPKATSTVKNTFVPGSNAPQAKEASSPKPVQPHTQTPPPVKTPEPIKEDVHKDVSLMVENITDPLVVPEKKDPLVLDNTIDHVKNEERNVRREEIVKETEAKNLVDLNPSAKAEENKPNDQEAPKFRKLSTFEDIDKK